MNTNETVAAAVNVIPVKRKFPPNVLFTPTAWVKTERILDVCSTNVLWHALVKHPSEKSYIIYDVLPVPQYVENRSNHLDTDDYQEWFMDCKDRWLMKNRYTEGDKPPIYLLGMLKASGNAYQLAPNEEALCSSFVESAPEDGFYIFTIYDKQGHSRYIIHDKRNGMIYDSKEVAIPVDITKMDLFTENVLRNITVRTGDKIS